MLELDKNRYNKSFTKLDYKFGYLEKIVQKMDLHTPLNKHFDNLNVREVNYCYSRLLEIHLDIYKGGNSIMANLIAKEVGAKIVLGDMDFRKIKKELRNKIPNYESKAKVRVNKELKDFKKCTLTIEEAII